MRNILILDFKDMVAFLILSTYLQTLHLSHCITVNYSSYSDCSKILNIFPLLSMTKMAFYNIEEQSDLGLHYLSWPFGWVKSVQPFQVFALCKLFEAISSEKHSH